jgi:hypothetical protein
MDNAHVVLKAGKKKLSGSESISNRKEDSPYLLSLSTVSNRLMQALSLKPNLKEEGTRAAVREAAFNA